jgi:hypothetical protein
VVARWGGDEFFAIVETNLSGAELCAKRVRQWVFGDYTVQTGERASKIRVEGEVGVAEWLPGQSATEVIRRADAAMYEQKRSAERAGRRRAYSSPGSKSLAFLISQRCGLWGRKELDAEWHREHVRCGIAPSSDVSGLTILLCVGLNRQSLTGFGRSQQKPGTPDRH